MRSTIFGCLAALGLGVSGAVAQAQTCGGTYEVRPGDSLSGIAERVYGDATVWTALRAANAAVIGESASGLRAGTRLSLPCLEDHPIRPRQTGATSATGAAAGPGRIEILTGSDFAPFADAGLPGGGMLTEVVAAAMRAADPADGFAIHWVDDRASHHEPLLSNALLDLGFPWFRPDCTANPETYPCEQLYASAPLFEVLTLLFVASDRPRAFRAEGDLDGARLCRPRGYSTYIFEQDGRNWLTTGAITLVRPERPSQCFELLLAGEVDGVVLNEFLGRHKIRELGLEGRVEAAAGRPISLDGVHMVAHKSNPQARAMLKVFDAGLAQIKANGIYQGILDAHMTRVWAEF